MNTIAAFRLCTLSNEDLMIAIDKATDSMFETGKIPDRQIPARPNEDYDLLVGELLLRCKDILTPNEDAQWKLWKELEGYCGEDYIPIDTVKKLFTLTRNK